jgi:hypothetical protein
LRASNTGFHAALISLVSLGRAQVKTGWWNSTTFQLALLDASAASSQRVCAAIVPRSRAEVPSRTMKRTP